jgi:hypothetical protein
MDGVTELGLDAVRELTCKAFGEWTMVRTDAEWAATAVSHEQTRRMLVEVGLPVETNIFTTDDAFFVRPTTMGAWAIDHPDRWGSDGFAAYRDWIVLGREVNGGRFVVDPGSGRVDFLDGGDGMLQSSTLAIFVYALAYFETRRRLDGVLLDDVEPMDLAFEANYETFRHLSLVDPPAFQGVNAPPWAEAQGGELDLGHAWEWIADGFADGLFSDWTWSNKALRYFAARGIDPRTREPRRT